MRRAMCDVRYFISVSMFGIGCIFYTGNALVRSYGVSVGFNWFSQTNGDQKCWWFCLFAFLFFFGQTIIKLSEWPNDTRKYQTFPMNYSFYHTHTHTHGTMAFSLTYEDAHMHAHRISHTASKKKYQKIHNQMHIHTPHVRRDCFYCLDILWSPHTIRDNFTSGIFSVFIFRAASEYVCVCGSSERVVWRWQGDDITVLSTISVVFAIVFATKL